MSEKLIDLESALKLDKKEAIQYYRDHINPAFARLLGLLNFDKQYVRASGTKVWDSEGNEYLDFLGGYGALNLGHNPPAVLAALARVQELPNLLQASMGTMNAVAAYNLSQLTPGDLTHTFFCNSGAEAVEGAIKLARIASGKSKIIYCFASFHGKTMGSLSVTGRTKYQEPFQPLIPGNNMVPCGELDVLEKFFKDQDIAAFIVEPIQGEGGILLPPEGYLQGVRELCDRYQVYLILDEIQTGFGRTGTMFACEESGVVPDIMCLAKALGGGVMPIGAYISNKEIWQKAYGSTDKALLHTSTFGGNTLATTAAIAAMNEMVTQDVCKMAREKGDYFIGKLTKLAAENEMIKQVRGKGLLIGIEFNQPDSSIFDKISGGMLSKLSYQYTGSLVAGTLLNQHRIISAYTLNNPNVIRLEPPLTVSYQEMDQVLNALHIIFSENKGIFNMALSSAKTVLGGLFNK